MSFTTPSPTIEPIRFDETLSPNNTTIPFKSIVSHAMASTILDPFDNVEELLPFSLFIFGGQINNKRSDNMFECRIEKQTVTCGEHFQDDLLLEKKICNQSHLTITEFTTCDKRGDVWPSARSHHQIIYRAPNDEHIEGSLILFGGQDTQFKALGDLFEFDIHTREWKQIGEQFGQLWPTRRYGHSMIYRPSKDSIVILGGVDTQNRTIFEPFEYSFSESLWRKIELIVKTGSALSLTNSSNIDPSCLRPRANHSAVLYNAQHSKLVQFHTLNSESVENSSQDVMVIFGGNNEQDYFNDMFSINLGTLEVNTIMSSHRINVYPRMKHTCIITREEKALVIGGNRKARYDEMKIISGKTVRSFFMSVFGSIAPKSSIDASLVLNGMVSRNLVTEFNLKNDENGFDFSEISHNTTCSISPSCFIIVGGQFNNVGEKLTNVKNEKIWVCNLGKHFETIAKLQQKSQKKQFGKEFYQRMLDNLGEYGPIGHDMRVNVLNEKTFLVHKFMLSRFDFFKKLIEEYSSNLVDGLVEVPITDASVDTISHIIDYIYGIEPPVFSNPEEVQILNKYCEKHSMNSIVKYTHGKTYLQESEYETFLPEIQLLLFFERVYMGEFPELNQYFNSTIRLNIQEGNNSEPFHTDIKIPLQILVNNDFFHACLRDLWIKHKLNQTSGENYTIEIDNSIFPFLDGSYIPIIEKYIATLYQCPVHIVSSEGESVVSQLIQLYLVSNLLSDTFMESLIMGRCKSRISFENAFQLLCFAYQHQSPNEVVFIYNECIRKLKEVISLEDVNKIINFLNQEYAKQFE